MNDFSAFIAGHGYEPPSHIDPGKIMRFGKNKSAWARLFDDCTGGVFGDWRTGEQHIWQSGSKPIPKEVIIKAQLLAKKERDEDYSRAANLAQKRFEAAKDADPNHPYLVAKKVKGHGLKQVGNLLMVPVYSVLGKMQSLQTIDTDGKKQFMSGGKMSGGCHMIGMIDQGRPAIICEGYATGASIHEADGNFVVISFTSWNLKEVAMEFHKMLPEHPIIIAGDDDWMTPGNPGKTAAIEAAKAVSGRYLLPQFGSNRQPGWTDFNDLMNVPKEAP
jgi:putative DNA primase/helicase